MELATKNSTKKEYFKRIYPTKHNTLHFLTYLFEPVGINVLYWTMYNTVQGTFINI
jgi:hypothetical protein